MMNYSSASNSIHSQESDHQSGTADGCVNSTPSIAAVVLGDHLIRPWYASSYPKEREMPADSRLYVCDACFKYTSDAFKALGHSKCCSLSRSESLGTCLYRTPQYSIYEVDGKEHTLFCQNLSLFAKLFLGTKSVCYNVQAFRFYTLIEHLPDTNRHRVVGFFSKEKMSWDDYNLACILVFPPFQGRGLGKLLIAFSYELSKMEEKVGSPEQPLSELGRIGYMAYWTSVVADVILNWPRRTISVNDIVRATHMQVGDIDSALGRMGVKMPLDGRTTAIPRSKVERWQRRQPALDSKSIIETRCLDVQDAI